MRKRLLLAVALLATMVTAGWAPAAAATLQADDDQSDEELLDLAAMVPGPEDLPEDGYGVSYSESLTLAGYAELLNNLDGGRPGNLDDVLEALTDAGWRQWYGYRLSVPSEDDPDFFGRSIIIEIAEYGDDDGAEAGYELLTDANEAAGFEETTGGDEIGDRSVLLRFEGTLSGSGDPYQELALVFQSDTIVAQVTVVDFLNDAPPASEANELGEDLVDRIEDVLDDGSAGLGRMVLRIEVESSVVSYDYYRNRDGETIRTYDDTDASFASAEDYRAEIGRTDFYMFQQSLPGEDGTAGIYNYLVDVQRFEDEDAAAAWIEEIPAAFVENPASAYTEVELVDDPESLGDQAELISFEVTRRNGDVAQGYQYYIQVEDLGVVIQLNGLPEAPRDALEELASDQTDCLEAGACAGWAAMPAALDGDDNGEEVVEVSLDEVDDSGVRGEAVLESADDETTAEIALRGGEEGMQAVVQGGTCDDLDPAPVSELAVVDDDGTAMLEIPLALEELVDEEHALAVYGLDALDEPPVACGAIEG